MSEDSIFNHECRTIFNAFQMKKISKTGSFCFFFIYVGFGEEKKEDKITAYATYDILNICRRRT